MASFLVVLFIVWTKKERWEPELGAGYPFKKSNSHGHFVLASFNLLDDVTIVPPNSRISGATSARAIGPWGPFQIQARLSPEQWCPLDNVWILCLGNLLSYSPVRKKLILLSLSVDRVATEPRSLACLGCQRNGSILTLAEYLDCGGVWCFE